MRYESGIVMEEILNYLGMWMTLIFLNIIKIINRSQLKLEVLIAILNNDFIKSITFVTRTAFKKCNTIPIKEMRKIINEKFLLNKISKIEH